MPQHNRPILTLHVDNVKFFVFLPILFLFSPESLPDGDRHPLREDAAINNPWINALEISETAILWVHVVKKYFRLWSRNTLGSCGQEILQLLLTTYIQDPRAC